ncbi:MAG TPA: DUF6799 domain-containing protein [Verrucomicrobiae bacterium]
MKNNLSRLLSTTLSALAFTCASAVSQAQEQPAAEPAAAPAATVAYESVTAKDNQTYGLAANLPEPILITNVVQLGTIIVNTNGTFKIGEQGTPRTLKPGQVLGKDGRLTDADGSIVPVEDHVTKKGGVVTLVKDGVAGPLTAPLTLGDGSTVTPDGQIQKEGKRRFLVEGMILQLSGAKIEAVDSATMVAGQVRVQLNGENINVAPNRSITMNDGTRVFGDGRVVKFRGGEIRLQEGQILRIEGVATK